MKEFKMTEDCIEDCPACVNYDVCEFAKGDADENECDGDCAGCECDMICNSNCCVEDEDEDEFGL